MNRKTPSAVLLGSAGCLGLLTYALLAWDRTHHSMVSGPNQAEVRLALMLWSFTLAIYFVLVPVTLALRRGSSVNVSWPLREALCLAAALVVIGLFFEWLPLRRGLFSSDLELTFVCYMFASVGYVSAVAKMCSTWRARSWSRFAAASAVAATSGATVFAASWAVVYFE